MPPINPITTWEEITIKAQEFTDRLDAQLAWIGAAQTSADDAQADATQALATIYQTGLDAFLYTDQKIQALRSELTGGWTTAEGTITTDVTNYVDQYYANLLADIDAKNTTHSLSLQGVEDEIWNLFGTVDSNLTYLSNTELPSVNAWIQSLIGDLTAVEDGITILTANMQTSSIYDEINAYTVAVKSSIEDPLGNSIGATLSQNYLTAVGTQNAISVANLALKAEIEDPLGSSIGAALENSYYTSAQADQAMAGQISTYNASVEGGIDAQVTSHTTAIANLEGNASAAYVMRIKAGTAGAQLEMVAADDPINGPASSLRLAADDIILDGSVTAQHINATGLTIPASNIAGSLLQSQVSGLSSDLTTINNTANNALSDASTAQSTANTALSTANSKIKTYSQSITPSGANTGDLWHHTTQDKFYRYTGVSWVPVAITADSIVASYVYSGAIATSQLQIDNITLDSDGSGNLIVKGGGVNTLQLADNAVTYLGTDEGSIATAEASCMCPVGSNIVAIATIKWSINNANGTTPSVSLSVNGNVRTSGDLPFVNTGGDGIATLIFTGISGGTSIHTMTAGFVSGGNSGANVNLMLMSRRK